MHVNLAVLQNFVLLYYSTWLSRSFPSDQDGQAERIVPVRYQLPLGALAGLTLTYICMMNSVGQVTSIELSSSHHNGKLTCCIHVYVCMYIHIGMHTYTCLHICA